MKTRHITAGFAVAAGIAVALSMGQGQLGGGGLTRVVTTGGVLSGSGTTSNALGTTLDTTNHAVPVGNGSTYVSSPLTYDGAWLDFAGKWGVEEATGYSYFGGNISGDGTATITGLGTFGGAQINGNAQITGDTQLGVDAADTTTLTGKLTLNGWPGTPGQIAMINAGDNLPIWVTPSFGGITNSAGANVITKSNGTNLVASSVTDDGTTWAIATNKVTVAEASGNTSIAGTLGVTGLLTATAGGTTGNNWTTTGTGDLVSADDLTVADDATISDSLVCVGATDLRGTVADSTGALSLLDDVDVGLDSGSTLSFSNSAKGAYLNYDGKHGEVKEDFLFSAALNSGASIGFLTCTTSGTGAVCSAAATGAAGRGSIAQMSMGTTSTGRTSWNASFANDMDDANHVLDVVLRWPTASTSSEGYATLVGLLNNISSVVNNSACYFAYDERNAIGANASNTANLTVACGATKKLLDGSSTCDDGLTSVATAVTANNWMRLQIRTTATSAVDFYADTGSGLTKRCRLTTGIPTTQVVGPAILSVKSVGTTARVVDVDFIGWTWDYVTQRSP